MNTVSASTRTAAPGRPDPATLTHVPTTSRWKGSVRPRNASLRRGVLAFGFGAAIAALTSIRVYQWVCDARTERDARLAAAQATNLARLRQVFDVRSAEDARKLRDAISERRRALETERARLKQLADSTYRGPVGREGERRDLRRGLTANEQNRLRMIQLELTGLARATRLLEDRR